MMASLLIHLRIALRHEPACAAPLALLLTLALLAGSTAFAQTAVAPAAGDGLSTTTAYQFTELGNLVWLADQASSNSTCGKYYKLMNDIDASATATWNDEGTSTDTLEGFRPIGINGVVHYNNNKYVYGENSFNGIFLGQGHTIAGLVINRPQGVAGLFNSTQSGTRIQDLQLTDCVINGYAASGMLAANYYCSTVINCSASGQVTGEFHTGGLIGYCFRSTVIGSHSSGTVAGRLCIGGLIGFNSNIPFVNYTEGYDNYTDHCYSTCTVSSLGFDASTHPQYMGGLIGMNDVPLTRCYATGDVDGYWNVGGLVGNNYKNNIANCYATGKVSGIARVGGLTGSAGSGIVHCYATGAVSTTSDTQTTGGLVGDLSSDVTASYWNLETSGLLTSDGGTSLTTVQMKTAASFTGGDNPWDFAQTWGIDGGYPYLATMPTCTLTYASGAHGLIGDGLTTVTALSTQPLVQVTNLGAAGTPVRAVADDSYVFAGWSDGRTDNPRLDTQATTRTVTAIFRSAQVGAAARQWRDYE